MKITAEMHEVLSELGQTADPVTATTGKVRPRIQRPKARIHFHPQTEKLTTYTVALAQAMGLPTDSVSRVGAAAALHDIGKINATESGPGGPKSRKKSVAEDTPKHPKLTAELIRNLHGFAACVPAILYHHECYDGTGYPEGLKGNKIPIEARLLAVTDWFSAVTTDQPGQPALSAKEAMAQLTEHSGTRFDPAIVSTFTDVINSGIASASREDIRRPGRRSNR